MDADAYVSLSDRERLVMDVLARLEHATVAEIAREMPDGASGEAVRAALRVLREKGLVTHQADGRRYAYSLTVPPVETQLSAVSRLVRTVFGGSRSRAMAALLRMDDPALSERELDRLSAEIEEAERRAGKADPE